MRGASPSEERLVSLLAGAARGPEQEGLFALWLVVRVAEALVTPLPPSPRAHRRRLQALEARLATLVVPGPLHRAFVAACHHLEPATPAAGALALAQLRQQVSPAAREA